MYIYTCTCRHDGIVHVRYVALYVERKEEVREEKKRNEQTLTIIDNSLKGLDKYTVCVSLSSLEQSLNVSGLRVHLHVHRGFESRLRQLFFSGEKELSLGVVACICLVSITDHTCTCTVCITYAHL